ncbi:hypothetical protein PV726_29445 [Streptomyces europaeiscabiei]|uniref:hypothetical protein n=1 Tax=Streptomyces europaeiscabiei TaxID=146819 RepID=UPI0029A44437|nr:hypothetical protein [Streptomyces europaeiscabiei]MDX3694389.1 hypothetical protein [Streptomyces europaeiscabiei]
MSQTAPAPSVVRSPLLRQSPVDIRPQDTDSSALPPLRAQQMVAQLHPGRGGRQHEQR